MDVNQEQKQPPGTDSIAQQKEKEDRVRLVKERQNEERQRKLEELKAQALAAQKYREQKDEERRRRIDDMKARDADRRSAVEERKRAIEEAEKDRREYLLRKNMDREAKFDAKRKSSDRNSAVFAFGSSTPRLLDPGEMGTVSPSNFWNHRRSTSISNISYSGQPLTRRSSERELTDGPKKRATSAGGDRQVDDLADSPQTYRSVARRKTDLMPTLPSPRDGIQFGSRSSLTSASHTPRSPGLRSGEVTPSGTGSSRPTSAMSTSTITSTVSRRSTTTPRKPRPFSIAGTGMSVNGSNGVDLMTTSCSSISSNPRDSSNKLQKERPPLPKPQAASSASPAGKRTPLNTSRDSLMTRSMDLTKRPSMAAPSSAKKTTPAKPSTKPLPSPGQEQKPVAVKQKSAEKITKEKEGGSVTTTTTVETVTTTVAAAAEAVVQETVEIVEQKMEQLQVEDAVEKTESVAPAENNENLNETFIEAEKKVAIANQEKIEKEIKNLEKQQESVEAAVEEVSPPVAPAEVPSSIEEAVDMTASMIAKSKIKSEEEAKAALAERRRLARLEAERQAELERQRLEAEAEAERKRLMEEEERYRQMEVEANRVAEEARRAEEERLALAIEEAKKKEEEDRAKKEEENRLKQEQLEQERKAREEAEKQRLEMAEKLKKEEKEREERRKRVEAIMSRTRAKGSAPNTPVKSGEEEKPAETAATEKTDIPRETTTNAEQSPNGNSGAADQQQQQQGTNGVLGLKNGQQESYEKSVTDKENALLGSFDNHFIPVEANNNNVTATATEGENGFRKNGIDNGINSMDISSQMLVDENNAKNLAFSAETTVTSVEEVVGGGGDQLIDFGADSMPHINNNANIMNNNNNTTTGAASQQLVTDLF